MSDLIAVPTVEQINLEHQLANSKANEAVQHATNCGLMLLQVKASLQHGEWLPWLNGEIESGRLNVKSAQAHKWMRIAANLHRSVNLMEAPSINAALELISDKEPAAEQSTLIPVDPEAERKARIVEATFAESDRKARERASRNTEAIARRNDKLVAKNKDYERKISLLEMDLAIAKADKSKQVDDQVRTKLRGYQDEVDQLEAKKQTIEEIVDRKKAYLDSLSSEVKRIEVHQSTINGVRLELIGLAAFLSDLDPIKDQDTIKKWLALGLMLGEAQAAIESLFSMKPAECRDLRIVA